MRRRVRYVCDWIEADLRGNDVKSTLGEEDLRRIFMVNQHFKQLKKAIEAYRMKVDVHDKNGNLKEWFKALKKLFILS